MKNLRLLVLCLVLISTGLSIADGNPPTPQIHEGSPDGNNCQNVVGTCEL